MKHIYIGFLFIVILIIAAFAGYHKFLSPKMVYVDSVKVYNGYVGKKELEAKYEAQRQRQQTYLDSMFLDLQMLEKKLGEQKAISSAESEKYAYQKKVFEQLADNFQKSNKELEAKYMDVIWKNLNQYIQDYGKEQGYAYIFGATGSGDLMYANNENDITKKVTEYANKRYSGK